MNTTALRALGSRAGWTAGQALIGAVAAGPLVDALHLPASYKPVAVLVVASLLSVIKSYVASKVGDPATVTFTATPPVSPPAAVLPPLPSVLLSSDPNATSGTTPGVNLPPSPSSSSDVQGVSGDS